MKEKQQDIVKKQQDIVRKELYATLYPEKFRLDFIAAIAGDRDLTPKEQQLFEGLRPGSFVRKLYHLGRLLSYTFTSFTWVW